MKEDRPFWRSASVLSALGALVVLVASDAGLRHAGGKASDLTLFVGRFHPLAVHLPIGIILLVAAGEAATLWPRLRPRVDPAIGLALPVLVAAAGGAFLLGQLLARSGDFAPAGLNVHRRLELFAVVGVCLFPLAWAYQEHAGTAGARSLYRALLGVTLGILSLGAHFGGTLTRGDTYLSRYAPGPLKRLLGGSAPAPVSTASAQPKAKEPRLFGDVIQPLLTERCVPCHGGEKIKGGLRLDSLDAINKGGEDGPALLPGNPQDSVILQRVLLPKDDDDHMPPDPKPGLTPAEAAILRFWIERGANDSLLVRDLLAPSAARTLLERSLGGAQTPTAISGPAGANSPAAAAPDQKSAPPAAAAPPPGKPAPTGAASPPGTAVHGTASPPVPAANEAATSTKAATSNASSGPAVLADKCEKCHGAAKQQGKLRVDSLDALIQGGKSGPALVPGNAGKSRLIGRVQLPLDDDKHMPPAKEPQLSAHEIALLTSWIGSLAANPSPSSSPAEARSAPSKPAAPLPPVPSAPPLSNPPPLAPPPLPSPPLLLSLPPPLLPRLISSLPSLPTSPSTPLKSRRSCASSAPDATPARAPLAASRSTSTARSSKAATRGPRSRRAIQSRACSYAASACRSPTTTTCRPMTLLSSRRIRSPS